MQRICIFRKTTLTTDYTNNTDKEEPELHFIRVIRVICG